MDFVMNNRKRITIAFLYCAFFILIFSLLFNACKSCKIGHPFQSKTSQVKSYLNYLDKKSETILDFMEVQDYIIANPNDKVARAKFEELNKKVSVFMGKTIRGQE